MQIENGLHSYHVVTEYASHAQKQLHQEVEVKILVQPAEREFSNIWYWKEYMKSNLGTLAVDEAPIWPRIPIYDNSPLKKVLHFQTPSLYADSNKIIFMKRDKFIKRKAIIKVSVV